MLALVLAWITADARAQSDSTSLEELRFKYEVEQERLGSPLAKLDASFKARLKQLEEASATAGELGRVLLIREELELLGKPGHAKAGEFAELGRLQEIYDAESGKLLAERDGKLDALMAKYQERLSQLSKELTKTKKIEEAVAADEELRKITSAREKLLAARKEAAPDPGKPGGGDGAELEWQAIDPAQVVKSDRDPGSVGVESTKAVDVVYLAKPLPTRFTLKGEFYVKGSWAGFAVGLDPRAREFLSVYSNMRAGTRQERVLGGARKVLVEDEKVRWNHDDWERFELVRDSDEWSLKVGTKTVQFRLPDGVNGRYVGLVSYPNSAILVRKLSLTKD